jgi:glucose/arabinose dehydrogenase
VRVGLMIAIAGVVACGGSDSRVKNTDPTVPNGPSTNLACDADNGGITLPAGFCATIFADGVGSARHLVVTPAGIVYTMLSGGAVLALRDTNGDGRSDIRASFGRQANTGVFLRGNELYADHGSYIARYHLTPGALLPSAGIDTIVRGLPTGGHSSRSIAIDASGSLFVGVGSASNICEGSPRDPCGELPTRAGVWRFDANATGQTFAASARYATGIRNAVGLAVHPITGLLYVTQHGRDDLYQSFPSLFTASDGAENPAEELLQVNQGDDFGWPYCYYDQRVSKLVLGPEYGGNRSTVGRCSTAKAPVTAFPGHWAPNGLVFYSGTSFPEHYRNGAFVAFHGSWNRAPQPQAGYLVAFVPANGNSLGSTYELFATGLAGSSTITNENQAAHRPTGLAVDASGALYITDDSHGRIWRVVYRGQ